MAIKRFQEGNKEAHGGARPGAGRPAEWLRNKCQDLVDKNKIIEFLAEVVASNIENTKDRIHAAEILLDRGFGKPNQTMEVKQIDAPTFGILPAGAISQICEALKKGSD